MLRPSDGLPRSLSPACAPAALARGGVALGHEAARPYGVEPISSATEDPLHGSTDEAAEAPGPPSPRMAAPRVLPRVMRGLPQVALKDGPVRLSPRAAIRSLGADEQTPGAAVA